MFVKNASAFLTETEAYHFFKKMGACMNRVIIIGIFFAIALVSFNVSASEPNLAKEVAGILYVMGQDEQATVDSSGNVRKIIFEFNPTSDIDAFSRKNLSRIIYVDAGKKGLSDEDTLITRMSFIVKEYNERFDGRPAFIDYWDCGLRGNQGMTDTRLPGADWYDNMHYMEVSGEKIAKGILPNNREGYGVVMSYVKEKLLSHQRKSKK